MMFHVEHITTKTLLFHVKQKGKKSKFAALELSTSAQSSAMLVVYPFK
ncbi:hypothetical protein PE36_15385 [Moritella sp. PE36]|nr:hypothetical protein PE36_15385 [Moritella sp. PE36]